MQNNKMEKKSSLKCVIFLLQYFLHDTYTLDMHMHYTYVISIDPRLQTKFNDTIHLLNAILIHGHATLVPSGQIVWQPDALMKKHSNLNDK